MDSDYRRHRQYPSFFFPIALITVGVVWLLVNSGTIPIENVYRLLPLWPVLIILAGISLLLRRLWWPINALIWLGAAALVLWLLTLGSGFMPAVPAAEIKHETLREPVGQAKSAQVMLDLSINPTTVRALEDSTDLIVADVYFTGDMRLQSSGADQKVVRMVGSNNENNFFFNPRIDQWFEIAENPWQIGLTPTIPLALTVDGSTGETDLDLAALELEELDIQASTGSLEVILPPSEAGYPVRLDASTGSADIRLPEDTPVTLDIKASTGSIIIDVPDGAGVQLEVTDDGTGGLNLPSGFEKVRAGDDEEGLYENEAYAGARNPIRITLDMSTGSVTLR